MYCVDGAEAVSVDKRSTVGTDGCHVGEIFFQSLAKALNKTIIVYADTPGYAVEYPCSNADAEILRVGYVNDNHYVGILHSSVVSDGDSDDDYDCADASSPNDSTPLASARVESPAAAPSDPLDSPRAAASPKASVDDDRNDDYPVDSDHEDDDVSTDETDQVIEAVEESQTMVMNYEEMEEVDAGEDLTEVYENERNQIAETLMSFSAGGKEPLTTDQTDMLGEKEISAKLGFTRDAKTVGYHAPAIHENVTLTVANEASKPLKVNYILTILLWLTILL
jgi:hypothetical protein